MKTFKTKLIPYGYIITVFHNDEIISEKRYIYEAAYKEVARLIELGYMCLNRVMKREKISDISELFYYDEIAQQSAITLDKYDFGDTILDFCDRADEDVVRDILKNCYPYNTEVINALDEIGRDEFKMYLEDRYRVKFRQKDPEYYMILEKGEEP